MKYVNQKTKFDCGVVAIQNAASWANKKLTKKQLEQIKKDLNFIPKGGVDPHDFQEFIEDCEDYGFKLVDTYERPTLHELKQELKLDQIIVLGTDDGKTGHVCLLIKITDKTATLVNWSRNKPITRMQHKTFNKLLADWCIAYVLERT